MNQSPLQTLRYGFAYGGWIPRSIDAEGFQPLPSASMSSDERWMGEALLTAMEGVGRASPNPSVGALLVKDGQVLARGATLSYGDLHAERVALAALPPGGARGATCYVTLEPCAGIGKQAPCVDALLEAGIGRCVIGAMDPHPKASGLGLEKLRAAGIEVQTGCLEAECRAWHFPFLAALELQRPVVIGKWAQTLDGHLADDMGGSKWISGPRSRAYTHWLRQKYDAILVGIGTCLADTPSLTVRNAAPPLHRHPHKVVYDPYAALCKAPTIVLAALRRELRVDGPQFFWMVKRAHFVEPSWAKEWDGLFVPVVLEEDDPWDLALLRLRYNYERRLGRALQSVMVEGGAQLLTHLMRADLLDALHVFIRAGVLGGQAHRIGRLRGKDSETEEQLNPSRALMDRLDYKLTSSFQIDQDVLLECAHKRFTFL